MYCIGFQSSKENGSACVFLKHDLFCTATIPCVCLSAHASLKDTFTEKGESCRYVLTVTPVESQVTLCSPQNISAAQVR